MRANEFLTEDRLDEGWKGALATVGFVSAMLAGTIIGTHKAEVASHSAPVRSATVDKSNPVGDQFVYKQSSRPGDSKEDLLKKVYGDNYYEQAIRPMIIKSVLDMATIVHSAHNMGMTRSQAISKIIEGGASGEVLKVGSAIATLEYSMPEGYWTSEEFKEIVYREVVKNIPEHD
jgi:hypothetical protein